MADDPAIASPSLVLRFPVPRPPAEAFAVLADRLTDGLRRLGIQVDPRVGGALKEGPQEFGRLTTWKPGEELVLEMRPITWGESPTVTVRLQVVPGPAGSLVTLEADGWGTVLEAFGGGPLDWYAGTLLPAVLRQLAPSALGDWVTDRKARRPTGDEAMTTYRDPVYHWPNFLSILDRIQLSPSDRLLEVACGGGAFLHKALESGCTAVAVDHSPDMLLVAREANRTAIESGRLVLREGEADRLPVPDAAFTCCVCTGAIGFFPDSVAALREMHRALAPGGRIAVYGSSPSLRGTPAAPEPIASRVRFFEAEELVSLARAAGFTDARVEPAEEGKYARSAGLPAELVAVFDGLGGGYLLLARKA